MTHGRLDELPPAPDTPRFRSELGAYLHARTRRVRRGARRGGRWLAMPGVAVAVTVAVALVLGGPVTGDPPQTVTLAGGNTLVLSDGTKISIGDFYDPANFDRLRKALEDVGATLEIKERPVDAAAEGRVLRFTHSPSGREPTWPPGEEITFASGDEVEVLVGRAARDGEQVATEGLDLLEVFPEIMKAFQFDDPVATGEALERLGFTVEWRLITFEPDGSFSPPHEGVDAPPPGTYVHSVSEPPGRRWRDAGGQWHSSVDPDLDRLYVGITHDHKWAELHTRGLRELAKAVQFDDPVATGEALEQLGAKVRWRLITFKPDGTFSRPGKTVDAPPPGTYVHTVLNPSGEGLDTYTVEITHDREWAERRTRDRRGDSGG
jgi:hypothetical protein